MRLGLDMERVRGGGRRGRGRRAIGGGEGGRFGEGGEGCQEEGQGGRRRDVEREGTA